MKTMIRRAAVATATTALAASIAVPANAATDASKYRYGAIALNTETLHGGIRNETTTRAAAFTWAAARCRADTPGKANDKYCKTVVWVKNGCAAVAVKFDSKNRPVRWAAATGRYSNTAINTAKKRAQGPTSSGSVKTFGWLCTTRYY